MRGGHGGGSRSSPSNVPNRRGPWMKGSRTFFFPTHSNRGVALTLGSVTRSPISISHLYISFGNSQKTPTSSSSWLEAIAIRLDVSETSTPTRSQEWKLTRGTFRPGLLQKAQLNSEEEVKRCFQRLGFRSKLDPFGRWTGRLKP